MNEKACIGNRCERFPGKDDIVPVAKRWLYGVRDRHGRMLCDQLVSDTKKQILHGRKNCWMLWVAWPPLSMRPVWRTFLPRGAGSYEKFHQINEIGTENVAKVAARAGVEHLILISSVSVYGPYTLGLYDEDTPCHPVGPYPISKFHAELKAIDVAEKSRMALTILRLSTLYGEEDPGNIGRLIRSLDKGRFAWIGDGSNHKSLLHKMDAARACVTVASSPAAGIHVYNVSGQPCTMREIVDGIADALGKRPLPLRIPKSLALAISRNLSRLPNRRLSRIHQTVQKWMAEDVYDTSRFERDYEFCSQVGVREGLLREVGWYRNYRKSVTP